MESTKDLRRPSGILKNADLEVMQDQSNHQPSSHNEHVKFDEVIIAEHDQDRGTRQKIDEPKTPYSGDVLEEEFNDNEDSV